MIKAFINASQILYYLTNEVYVPIGMRYDSRYPHISFIYEGRKYIKYSMSVTALCNIIVDPKIIANEILKYFEYFEENA